MAYPFNSSLPRRSRRQDRTGGISSPVHAGRRVSGLIRDIARLYDIRSILGLSSSKKTIICPLPQHKHHNRTASFSIFTTPDGIQKWHCFGSCGQYGDIIDLAGFMHIPGYRKDNADDVKRAIAILTGSTPINPPKPETTKAPMLPNGLYKQYLPAGDEVIQYADTRLLTSETLEKFFVGQHCTGTATWMTMPTIHGDQLRGIKMRNLDPAKKKDRFRQIPGSVEGLFGYNLVNGARMPVLIVKGEIPAMTLYQYGYLACAPTGGEGSHFNHEELLRPLAFSDRRIVIGDNDIDPEVKSKMQAAAAKRAEIFRAAGPFFPPDPFVGIDDWINAEPDKAADAIHSWMEQ